MGFFTNWDGIKEAIISILLFLDAIVYSFVSYVYQIFLVLANGGNIIDNKVIEEFVQRLYLILGVVMLFILAYSLLKAMVNPDEGLKKDTSPLKFVTNVITSVVLIALIPTIFNFAFEFQSSLLKNNTVGKIILGAGSNDVNSATTISEGGYFMASTILNSFLHTNSADDGITYCESLKEEYEGKRNGVPCTIRDIKDSDNLISGFFGGLENVASLAGLVTFGILPNLPAMFFGWLSDLTATKTTYGQVWATAALKQSFFPLGVFSEDIVAGNITYYWLISTAAGVFVLFVLLSYVIDMAVRLVKLAVFEVMAPIAIFARIMPNKKSKDVFNNWVKATLSTFAEVFIRIALLFFAVLIIKLITNNLGNVFGAVIMGGSGARWDILLIAQCMLILGVFLFIKEAPQIIKDITGLDGGKYNPLKSAKQAFSALAGGIAGRSPLAAARAYKQAGDAKKFSDFSAIGNQFKRRKAKQDATKRQKEAGMNMAQRLGSNVNGAFRSAFGFGTPLEAADEKIKKHQTLDGKQMKVTNDSGTDVKGIVADGDTLTLTEENVNRLNARKAEIAKEVSALAETLRQYEEKMKVNKTLADYKGTLEDIAKKEMDKGKYRLKDKEGADLSIGPLIGTDGSQIGAIEKATKEQFEKWLAANQQRMTAADVAKYSKLIKDSANVFTVDDFINHNGEDLKIDKQGFYVVGADGKFERTGSINKEMIEKKTLLSQAAQKGFFDGLGELQKNIQVTIPDGDGEKIVNLSDIDASDIDASIIKQVKDSLEDINRQLNTSTEKHTAEDTKIKFDDESKAIERIFAQEKELAEVQKSSAKYKAAEANAEADKLRDQGGK